MTENEVYENLALCRLLLLAVAEEPAWFLEAIDIHDFNEDFIGTYFRGLVDILDVTA